VGDVQIELYARRVCDLPTLVALERALASRRVAVEMVRAADLDAPAAAHLPPGPRRSRLRVIVQRPGEPHDAPLAETEELALVWDSAAPPAGAALADLRAACALQGAGLVVLPGDAHRRALLGRVAGTLCVAGLARLDPGDLPGSPRERARQALGLGAGAGVLYAPDGAADAPCLATVASRVADLGGAGRTVLALPQAWPAARIEAHQWLASGRPEIHVLAPEQALTALCAADVFVGDRGEIVHDARALGLPVVLVSAEDARQVSGTSWQASGTSWPGTSAPLQTSGAVHGGPPDGMAAPDGLFDGAPVAERVGGVPALLAAVERTLERAEGPPEPWAELLCAKPGAAERIADALCARVRPRVPALEPAREPAASAAEPQDVGRAPASDFLATIEARTAFGDVDGPVTELAAHLQVEPSAAGFALLASIERKRGRLGEAGSAAERAIALGREGLGRALCESARVALDRDEPALAAAQLDEAHAVAPALPEAHVGLGTLALHRGEHASACVHFREALARGASSRAHAGLGLALAGQQCHREALASLEAALDLDPECQAALYGMVQVGASLGELDRAAIRVSAFVDLHPGNLGFTFTLAGLCARLGELDRARELVDRIALFDPAYPGLAELRDKLWS
jgi:tetratricopeptide (TPR) repeat protein